MMLLVMLNVKVDLQYSSTFSSLSLYRAIIIRNNEIIPISTEFTPESERQRLQFLVRKLCIDFYIENLFSMQEMV